MTPLVDRQIFSRDLVNNRIDLLCDRLDSVENISERDAIRTRLELVSHSVSELTSKFTAIEDAISQQLREKQSNPIVIKTGAQVDVETELRNGSVIVISGKPWINGHHFSINLIVRSSNGDNFIVLTMIVRFNDQSVTIRSGNFEESSNHFPFESGKFFDLRIRVSTPRLQIEVNRLELFATGHSFERINEVNLIRTEGQVDDVISRLEIPRV